MVVFLTRRLASCCRRSGFRSCSGRRRRFGRRLHVCRLLLGGFLPGQLLGCSLRRRFLSLLRRLLVASGFLLARRLLFSSRLHFLGGLFRGCVRVGRSFFGFRGCLFCHGA